MSQANSHSKIIQTDKTVLIIADLHLLAGDVKKNQLFERFCQQAKSADQVFILGDLFNTWLGDDLSLPHYQATIQLLKDLCKSVDVLVMTGNRDFLLSQAFVQQTNCKLINTPYLLELGKHQYVLTHGDELCTDDESYQQMKTILQHPITKAVFVHLPKKWRLKLSGQLRKKSVDAQQAKSREIMDVNPQTVNELMGKYPGADLIHGHTHRLNTHTEKTFTRYVLGDWPDSKGNAIKITSQSLSRLEIS
ncbi:MAG: UDP-2,3-diacylglucosamine diphosphatase [Candidatus Thioglobus sp.]|nr:UDP-2,3-diacylglucosamine diphosphatase [Candidatus Thioglobus pontius]MBL6985394.1 UDP-2,3-diacylglucosamine diphosphatase [Candidatus Thioglobus sp.]